MKRYDYLCESIKERQYEKVEDVYNVIGNYEVDLNPYTDVRFCNNGEGYPQYSVTYEINGCTLEYEDTSCGDFGDRYSTTFGPYSYSYDGVSCGGEYSDFPTTKEMRNFLNAIREEIYVPFYKGDR